ncbi:LysR family transcriptional regulator [Jatrophihabitans sp. YIM 134969]
MDTHISLHKLEVFRLIVQNGGVTRAAEILGVAQPAVSAQLRSLEKAMGAALFVRAGNRLELTEAGRRVSAWAEEVLAGSEQVGRDVQQLAAGTTGSLRVASSMAIGSYLLPPIMTRLLRDRPGADITVHIGEPATALRSVAIGTADLAVVTWDDDLDTSGLHAQRLRDEPLVLCASPDGPPTGAAIGISELAALPFVGVPQPVTYHRMLARQLRAHGVLDLDVVLRLGHAEPIKRAVAANHWVALIPAYAVADDVAAGRLRTVEVRGMHLAEGIALITRDGGYLTPLARVAIDAIRDGIPHSAEAEADPAATTQVARSTTHRPRAARGGR